MKIKGGVFLLKGFEVKGVYCGLCYLKKDFGVIISEVLVVSAVVYM